MNTKRLLRAYKPTLSQAMGGDHIKVLQKLSRPMYDHDISSSMKVKTTTVRKLLNELYDFGLVEYERLRDKKTGWYTYLWSRRDDRVAGYIKDSLEKSLGGLENRLLQERDNIMFACECQNGGENGHVTFGQAMEYDFICPVCNTSFRQFDNSAVILKLESGILELRRGLKGIGG
ncbi:MAG: hypothetical protein A7316_03060 [Candidatus Altiarchaeales archaeon WOR_SM1_86-2]|nr:MAG: hypothetical protein A7316_03060 [Candidatus Altiarchaeales archaeon WOR_SM1_86-2]